MWSHSICFEPLSASPTWRPALTGSKAPGDSWTSSSPVRGPSNNFGARIADVSSEPVPPRESPDQDSSCCDFLSNDEVISVRFVRLFLPERQLHSGLS